jgi:hypothetical protein
MSRNDGLLHIVLYIADKKGTPQVAYTIQTRYGQLLPVFVSDEGELPRFAEFAAGTLKPGYVIKTAAIVASNLHEAGEALRGDSLIPSTPTGLILEGSPFFDQVIRELEEGTIWPDS